MTRRSHRQALAMLAATSAALAMGEPRAAGCTMNAECKGVRICEDGRCVYPPEAGIEAPPATAAAAAAGTTAATPATAAPPVAVCPVACLPSASAAPSPASAATVVAEVGGFGFGIDDGRARSLGGGVVAGYRFLPWLAIGAWLEYSGTREQSTEGGTVTYEVYDLGLGPMVGKEDRRLFADLSVLPKLTRLTFHERQVVRGQTVSGRSATRWGTAADARLRLGMVLGSWRPFMFVAGSYAFKGESVTFSFADRGANLSRENVSVGVGFSYRFGADPAGDTLARP